MWFQQQQQQQQQPSRATTYPLPLMSMPLSLPPSYGAANPAQQLQAHQLAQLGQLGFPPSIATSLIAPMPGGGGGGIPMDMIDTVELTRTPESLPQSVGHSPVLASATVRPSLSSGSHPHRAGGSSSHRNKRRHSTTTDEEEDAEGEPDDEVEVPEGVERDGMIWGMKVEDYRSLSARERKRVRNRISARTFRAKRKGWCPPFPINRYPWLTRRTPLVARTYSRGQGYGYQGRQ